MGSPVKLCNEYEDEQDRQEKYADILAQYPQVQDQGDGMKSFVGILLQLMLDYICVYLIDEPESLFVHCGGKQRMAKVVLALRSLEIDVKLIPDLDALNDEATFKGITDSFAIDWNLIQGKYRIICSDIGNKHKNVNRESAKVDIDRILDSSSSEYLTSSEIERIRSVIKTESGWKAIKEYGVSGIPQGNASKAFAELDATLKNHGIFLVPVGELENFVRTVGGHGPAWVNKVLEQYPDLNSSVYDDIKEFIHNINL